jgi:hypothetical protein
MKKIALILATTFFLMGCYGKFGLTRKLYTWNGSLGAEPVQTLVMWVMMIVPIYAIVGAVDFLFLNTLDYWMGSNPLTLEEGEKEEQIVIQGNETFKIIATKNRFDIYKVYEKSEVLEGSLVYDEIAATWIGEKEGQKYSMAKEEGEGVLRLYVPGEEDLLFSRTSNKMMN